MPSHGDLAAAAENCIWVFHHGSVKSKGNLKLQFLSFFIGFLLKIVSGF